MLMQSSVSIHNGILEIFRPFVGQTLERSDNSRLSSFASADATPENIFAASLDQIKRLLVIVRIEVPKSKWVSMLNLGKSLSFQVALSSPYRYKPSLSNSKKENKQIRPDISTSRAVPHSSTSSDNI